MIHSILITVHTRSEFSGSWTRNKNYKSTGNVHVSRITAVIKGSKIQAVGSSYNCSCNNRAVYLADSSLLLFLYESFDAVFASAAFICVWCADLLRCVFGIHTCRHIFYQ